MGRHITIRDDDVAEVVDGSPIALCYGFTARLRARMVETGTQASDLAAALDISDKSFSRLLRRQPFVLSLLELETIADALGVEIDHFFAEGD